MIIILYHIRYPVCWTVRFNRQKLNGIHKNGVRSLCTRIKFVIYIYTYIISKILYTYTHKHTHKTFTWFDVEVAEHRIVCVHNTSYYTDVNIRHRPQSPYLLYFIRSRSSIVYSLLLFFFRFYQWLGECAIENLVWRIVKLERNYRPHKVQWRKTRQNIIIRSRTGSNFNYVYFEVYF